MGHLWILLFKGSMVNPDLVSPLLPRATTTQEFADSDTNMIDSLLLLAAAVSVLRSTED